MPAGFEPLHVVLALPRRTMRVFTPVIEVATLPVFHPGQDLPLRRTIAFELIGNDHPWHVLQALEQLTEKLLRRVRVAAALYQDIHHVVVLVDSAPQVMTVTVDGQEDFIKMPLVPWLGASTLQLIRVVLPKF